MGTDPGVVLLDARYIEWLLQGLGVTLALSASATVAAFVLAVPLCLARVSARRWLAWPAAAWLSLFRNTPLLVQLFFWYFGAAQLLPQAWRSWLNAPYRFELWRLGVAWPSFEFLAALFGLALYSAAFVAEELRAGVRGVGAGQLSAARALGLRPLQVWRHVVLPQALRIARPPLFGQVMNIAKNSSLAMAIGVAELSHAARQADAQSFQSFQVYALATLLYVAVVVVLECAARSWQQRDAARLQVR